MAPPLTAIRSKRIVSIDLLRGVVMILMVLDHVRDYFHAYSYHYDSLDLDHTSVAIFFTRWITHFCAPIFMFLAGISAFLYGAKRSRKELSFFLFTRRLMAGTCRVIYRQFRMDLRPLLPGLYFTGDLGIRHLRMIVLSALVYLKTGRCSS